eukprot:PITA_25838
MKERTDEFPVWVRVPGLPSFLWTESVFEAIGNRLGTFMEADKSYLKTKNRVMARILVRLKPSGGLPQKINLEYKEYLFEQILDYEHLPFRCHICHVYGHLAKECPLHSQRNRFRRKPISKDSYFNRIPHRQERAEIAKQSAEVFENENCVKEPAGEEAQFNGQRRENTPLSSVPLEEIAKDVEENPHPISDQEKAVRPVSPSIPPQNLVPVFNLVHVSPSVLPPHSSDHLISMEALTVHHNSSDTLLSLDLNNEEDWPPLVSPPSQKQCHYNLRSMGGKSVRSNVAGGGFANKTKKLALRDWIQNSKADIVFLQETLGKGVEVEAMLKTLVPGWVFSAIDASGHSGGLAIGCKEGRIKVINQWGSKNALGMEVLTPVSPRTFTILNIYGPCQGRESFWLDMMAKSFMKASMLIVGGDLNFTMGRAETWGPTAREDPLTDFFHKLIEDHHLADPHPIKLKATWRNRRVGEGRIAKRLDRFLLSEDLISNAPIIRQWVEEIGNSDHFPIFLECAIPPPKPPAPFKFNPAWLQDPTFVAILKNTWLHTNSSSRENKGFLFMENLKRLKKATVIWAKERRLNQNEALSKIREELELLESPEEDGYQSQSTKDRILQLEKGQNKILLDKEDEWRIKSRAIWLKSGDENTRFFHNYAKGRKSGNTIWSLKDEEGSEVSSFTELASLGKRHFERIFADSGEASIAQVLRTAQCFPRFVEEEEAEDLSRPVSKEEVEAAMKIMAKDKSPGPDGWTIELFLFFFDVIGSEITDVIEESRMKGEVYRPFNATFIALIPKKEDPGIFEDFRPISLCNCIYKIIAKVIAIRIFPFLSRNISSEQFGFLDGRQIHEAIGVAQEVIHSIRQKKKKGAVLKIDLSKAFDRVSWLYLRMMLTHLGFNYTFTSWIMGCISSVSFAVLINGSASTFFNSQRGLRQGCPLSPLLFLLVAEGLSRLIHKARREGKVKGIEVAINLFISHLFFVDDILIFTNGSSNEIKEYKSILDLFLIATGMEINTRKSQICVADLARGERDSISNTFTFPIQPLDTPFKYLGF